MPCTLGKGLERKVEGDLQAAARRGDWIILENLHLAEDWLPALEDLISKLRTGTDLSPRFRLWLTSVHSPVIPPSILLRSVKVAVQPPRTIRQEAEVMIKHQAKEQYFRKSGRQANLHQNLFFGLVYLHALLKGRRNYGHLGWNLQYKFDFGDFEVGSAQLASVVGTISAQRPASRPAALQVLSYLYSQVNYAGKIQRAEDQTILEAITGDLINERVANSSRQRPRDYSASTFGIPPEACPDPEGFLLAAIPDEDPYQVFGFNWNIASDLQAKKAFALLGQIQSMSAGTDPDSRPNTSVTFHTKRISLRTSGTTAQEVEALLANPESMLSLLAELQDLLKASSLDATAVANSGRRYDQQVEQPHLRQIDLNDARIA